MATERSEQPQLKPVEEILAHIASRGHEIGLTESDLATLQSRITGNGHETQEEKFLRYFPEKRLVIRTDGQKKILSHLENEFMRCLWENKNKVTPHDTLINRIWQLTFGITPRNLRQLAMLTKNKVEVDPHNPQFIITYAHTGYLLVGEENKPQEITKPESRQVNEHEEKRLRLQKAGFEYLFDQKVIRVRAKEEKLSPREAALMDYFYLHPDIAIRSDILCTVIKSIDGWNWVTQPNPSQQALYRHIFRLRLKIEPNPQNPQFIETWYGQGFLFNTYFHPFSHRPKPNH